MNRTDTAMRGPRRWALAAAAVAGAIHGCYAKSGDLRVVDPAAETCKATGPSGSSHGYLVSVSNFPSVGQYPVKVDAVN